MPIPRLIPAMALTLALAGCAGGASGPAASANPYPPVPPPLAETIGKPPVTAVPLLWQPGFWDWTGAGYVWRPGRYVARGTHSNLFMPGYWKLEDGAYRWSPAHWLPG